MNAFIEVKGVTYHADIEPKAPFRVSLWKSGETDRHYGHWEKAITFDVNKHSDLNVGTGGNSDGTKFAILPWPEGVYEALEVALKIKLIARKLK